LNETKMSSSSIPTKPQQLLAEEGALEEAKLDEA
jgi:hypothetical protein